MKIKYPAIFLFISIAFSSCTSVSQNSGNEELPIITALYRTSNITGWLKSPEGQWINKRNIIPPYIYGGRNPYDGARLGVDNIVSLNSYLVEYKGTKYFLLIKKYRLGVYQYPRLSYGYHELEESLCIITKDYPITIKQGLNEINTSYTFTLIDSEISNEKYLQLALYDILKKNPENNDILINISFPNDSDKLKFLIFKRAKEPETRIQKYTGFPKGTLIFSPLDGSDTDIDTLIDQRLFSSFFFEVKKDQFIKLFVINK